ncbi:MAG: hypothetical protein H6867_03700 [Rhodospirillales bacterium]|nr:hypothetical protein [Rhodospirillales bacterium]MCB9996256.1 hypothetical protein [Rhodospirillales bacterium]
MIANHKIKCLALLTLSVATVILTLSLYVNDLPVGTSDWVRFLVRIAGYAVTVTVLTGTLFDKYLWRYFPDWLLGIPKIHGTWKGDLKSRWINPETKEDIHNSIDPYFLSVRQTFSSLYIEGFSKESGSSSIKASLQKDDGGWKIIYAYDNEPELDLQGRSRRHRGGAVIKVHGKRGSYRLLGDYWTDRWTQGKMSFNDHADECASDYQSATAIFVGSKIQ